MREVRHIIILERGKKKLLFQQGRREKGKKMKK